MYVNESFSLEEDTEILNEQREIKTYYMVSDRNLEGKILTPRVPDNFMTKNGFEENKTPRVCASTSIGGCLKGLSRNLKGEILYIHSINSSVKEKPYKPSIKEVPDSKITNEVWFKKPVELKYIGKIKVISDDGKDGEKYNYGNGLTAELYGWKYKWLNIENYFGVFNKKIVKKGGSENMNLLETDLNSIVIFSTDILLEYICEEYLNTKIDNDKFNTINAIERYLVIELSQLIQRSKLDKMRVNDTIDNRFKELMYNRNEEKERNLMFEIKQIKKVDLSYDVLEAILKNSIFNPNNILYLKTILNSNGDSSNEEYLKISLATQNFLKSMELIKYLAMKLDTNDYRFLLIYNNIQSILYEFKDFYSDSPDFNLGIINGVTKEETYPNSDTITSDDINNIFEELKDFLINQVDVRLYYMINEFKCLSYRMEIRQQENNRGATLESFDLEKKYNDSLVKFENMDITDEDGEFDIIKLAEAYQLAHDICKYQYMQEADTKIITKGTNKITKAIGNASAKSRGMADAKSKVGAIKRGARIVDDRASDAINKKVDDIMNFSRDAKREKILTGKNTVRVSGVLKNAIKILVAGTAGVGLFGPIAGAAIGLIGVLGARGISKNVEDREKKRILLELETELKIVKEKVEDAKGENNKQQKYQLMRIQANLEKEITRIKHGLRYY